MAMLDCAPAPGTWVLDSKTLTSYRVGEAKMALSLARTASNEKAPRYDASEARRLFTVQMATLIGAGVHVVRALEVLEQQLHPEFVPVVRQIRQTVDGGRALSLAIGATGLFPRFYVALLRVAEQTGRLSAVLRSLADWEDRDQALKRQARSALAYPATVLGVTSVLTLGLLYLVLPGFFEMFATMRDLPLPTRLLMGLCSFLHSPSLLFVIGVSGLAALQGARFLRTDEGQRWWWSVAARVPGLGALMQSTSLARYALAMNLLCQGGLGILDSCELAAVASGNPLLEDDYRALRAAVESGASHSHYLQAHPETWPASFTQMVRVGEEAGRAPEIFASLAHLLEEEVSHRTRLLIQLTEPVLLCILGGTISGILVSIFIPLYGMLHGIG